MRIIRVFPRKTNATPVDDLVRIGTEPGLFDEADEVHVSVTFTWDLPLAERLVKAWSCVAPVRIGGPATGEESGEFVPGRYMKHGYTITSRGCPNRCAFCAVWRREHGMKELAIQPGHIVQDDNLLACSDDHVKRVFEMLRGQKQVDLRGIEAKLLKPWHVEEIGKLQLRQLFCAYDTPDDYEPLIVAGQMLKDIRVDLRYKQARCYVLCGYDGDSFDAAEMRMEQTMDAGFVPFAMLWHNERGGKERDWAKWQRSWSRPAIIWDKIKKRCGIDQPLPVATMDWATPGEWMFD